MCLRVANQCKGKRGNSQWGRTGKNERSKSASGDLAVGKGRGGREELGKTSIAVGFFVARGESEGSDGGHRGEERRAGREAPELAFDFQLSEVDGTELDEVSEKRHERVRGFDVVHCGRRTRSVESMIPGQRRDEPCLKGLRSSAISSRFFAPALEISDRIILVVATTGRTSRASSPEMLTVIDSRVRDPARTR